MPHPSSSCIRLKLVVLAVVALLVAALSATVAPAASAAPASGPTTATMPVPTTSIPAGCNRADLPRGDARCFAQVATSSGARIRAAVDGPPATALGPTQIQSAYALPAGGAGQTVAVVDAYGYAAAEADLGVYRSHYGLPACTTANGCFRKVDQTGGTNYPADNADWSVEDALDMDAVSAACPKCHILYVEANSADIADLAGAVDTAVSLGAKYVSNSYGVDNELSDEQSYDSHYNHPGVAVTVSAGDTGNVQGWPATNPNVISVGGTTLTRDTSVSRGWTESTWASGGSGCSLYEPKPAWQQGVDTDCAKRATADISADADPQSGLGVYDSLNTAKPWLQVGGTSLSSPLTAAMYAIAGAPAAKRYPVQDLYVNQGEGLHDVTTGSNGTCGGVLCTAGPGWDGPTGFGSPAGVTGLQPARFGTVSGTITSAGKPVAGASVTVTGTGTGAPHYAAATDANGAFSVDARPGTYRVAVTAFGYASTSGTRTVTAGGDVDYDASLAAVPSRTVSGRVTDASGHGWPLGATITIDGYPAGAIHSDPVTGAYSVDLPQNATYAFHVSAELAGYTTSDLSVHVGATATTANLPVEADQALCSAPGYRAAGREQFTDWAVGTTPQDGWTLDDVGTATERGWHFGPTITFFGQSNFVGTGGMGWLLYDNSAPVDSRLTSPALDLRAKKDPSLSFSYTRSGDGQHLLVQQSVDGGTTWTTIGDPPANSDLGAHHVTYAMTGAGGRADVRVRLRVTSPANDNGGLVELDDVVLGGCLPVAGGLVRTTVTDANSHHTVSGAHVVTPATDGATGSDGVAELFAPQGKQTITASAARYATASARPTIAADAVTTTTIALPAPALSVSTTSLTLHGELGSSSSGRVTVTNRGGRPLTISLSKQAGAFSGRDDAPATAWSSLPELPQATMDNVGGFYAGHEYTFGGTTDYVSPHTFVGNYRYDAGAKTWHRLADSPQTVTLAAGAFIGNTFYEAGGLGPDPADPNKVADATTAGWAYHADTDTWTSIAPMPSASYFAASAVLGGSLYLIGGCDTTCDGSTTVLRYDPKSNTWHRLADLPVATFGTQCGAVGRNLMCAGGSQGATAFVFTPSTGKWTPAPSMPDAVRLGRATTADGKLQVFGVDPDNASVAEEFDPVTNVWSTLPTPLYGRTRFAGACGIAAIGGAVVASFQPTGTTDAEELLGYDKCSGDSVPWLTGNPSKVTIGAGKSVRLTVTADSSEFAQPGVYRSRLVIIGNTPVASSAGIAVTYRVDPPRTWGEVAGVVRSAKAGEALVQAAVQLCVMYQARTGRCDHTITVSTDSHGRYAYWLDRRDNPVQLIASHDGYLPSARVVRVKAGTKIVANLSLGSQATAARRAAKVDPGQLSVAVRGR